MFKLDLTPLPSTLRVGTSSFSTTDWRGVFYPPSMKPGDFLAHYATIFDTVEIDATWHALPARRTVEGWAQKVPDGFVFSLKVPKKITHEAYLKDCRDEWLTFLKLLEPLGEKRGPLLFQFPYVAKGKDAAEYDSGADFQHRLRTFADHLPEQGTYVVEIRNAKWLNTPLLDLLRSKNIALSLPAYFTMPSARDLMKRKDLITGPHTYIRFLGHHRRMDKLVREARETQGKRRDWDEIIVDRRAETGDWARLVRQFTDEGIEAYAYFNNHFAGFAPGSIELFVELWEGAN